MVTVILLCEVFCFKYKYYVSTLKEADAILNFYCISKHRRSLPFDFLISGVPRNGISIAKEIMWCETWVPGHGEPV